MTIFTKGMGAIMKARKAAKVKKAAAAGTIGTGVIGLGIVKAKSILDKDTKENTTSRDIYMKKEKKKNND
tara:strand:+ start:192 stop:401 length:210 start_codon:yes stop_codon:yes gene_type:complete